MISAAVVLCVAVIECDASAIPMWEFLSRDEKVSFFENHSNQSQLPNVTQFYHRVQVQDRFAIHNSSSESR